jgi:hypothetical protein
MRAFTFLGLTAFVLGFLMIVIRRMILAYGGRNDETIGYHGRKKYHDSTNKPTTANRIKGDNSQVSSRESLEDNRSSSSLGTSPPTVLLYILLAYICILYVYVHIYF